MKIRVLNVCGHQGITMRKLIYSLCFIMMTILVSMSCYSTAENIDQLEASDNDMFGFVDCTSEMSNSDLTDEDNEIGALIVFSEEETGVVLGRSSSRANTNNRANAAQIILNTDEYGYDDSTKEKLILSRCLLGEGGWSNKDDWNGIMSVLINRNQTVARWQNRPIHELAAQYCHALWPNRRHSEWINNLTWGDMENSPAGWPSTMSWSNYRQRWNNIQSYVEEIVDGHRELESCPATHWGSRTDGAPAAWEVIRCGDTNNVFYR